jgi:hypothetical protein
MQTQLQEKCSLYKPYFYKGSWQMSVRPELVPIGEMLFKPWQQDLLSAVRAQPDKDKRSVLKRQLWAMTPSSISKEGRGEAAVIEHTGLLSFDIDKYNGLPMDETTLNDMFKVICKIPFTLYCGRSASGKGLWGLFRISDKKKHSLHFNAMNLAFQQIGIEIDLAPSSIASLRFVSYDPQAYYNENAEVFTKIVEPLKVVKTPLKTSSNTDADNSDAKVLIEKFNAQCTANQIHDILTSYGFNFHSVRKEQYRFTRPDKDTKAGLSVDYHESKRTLFCFSSDVPHLSEWKAEGKGWSCSPMTALLLYGCGGKSKAGWAKAFNYIRSEFPIQ